MITIGFEVHNPVAWYKERRSYVGFWRGLQRWTIHFYWFRALEDRHLIGGIRILGLEIYKV